MQLDVEAARRAALPLAERLGMAVEAFAEGVVRIADTRMEQALRVISIERGADPRDFALLPFGGAGPIHACSLAESLRIPRMLIPLRPGVLSAFGLALADFTVDASRTIMLRPEEDRLHDTWAACLDAFAPLEAAGWDALAQDGFAEPGPVRPTGRARLERSLDIRYKGQSFELTIPLAIGNASEVSQTSGVLTGLDHKSTSALESAIVSFHKAHEARYGYARPGAPVEIVNVRLTARGIRPMPEFVESPPAVSSDPSAAQAGETRMYCRGRWQDAPVYDRNRLEHGHELRGPALVVQEDATTALMPGWRARADAWLNLIAEAVNG
jgi:N-methylhydantoinase A